MLCRAGDGGVEWHEDDVEVEWDAGVDGPECAPGCQIAWLGDSFCDADCFMAACEFDEGDCAFPERGGGTISWSSLPCAAVLLLSARHLPQLCFVVRTGRGGLRKLDLPRRSNHRLEHRHSSSLWARINEFSGV